MQYKKLIVTLSVLTLLGAGCISFSGGGSSGTDGGVFKSIDRGQQWQQKSAVPGPQGVGSFGGTNAVTFAIDPQDHLAIYAGTDEAGMFYSFDGAESWRRPKDLASGFIAAVVVDPANKCRIYAATGYRILKTEDCNRTFKEIYREASPQTFISALAVNPFNTRMLYAGTVKGTLIKSQDGGQTWALEYAFSRNKVIDIAVDPRNSAVRYVALEGRGVWKTENDGATFQDISEGLKEYKDGHDARRLIIANDVPRRLLLAAKHKILRSNDGGNTWEDLPILSPESVEVLSLAVNPKNSEEIYYGTATTFYKTADGGQNWSTAKLPTSRTARALLVDFETPETIYLGAMKVRE